MENVLKTTLFPNSKFMTWLIIQKIQRKAEWKAIAMTNTWNLVVFSARIFISHLEAFSHLHFYLNGDVLNITVWSIPLHWNAYGQPVQMNIIIERPSQQFHDQYRISHQTLGISSSTAIWSTMETNKAAPYPTEIYETIPCSNNNNLWKVISEKRKYVGSS